MPRRPKRTVTLVGSRAPSASPTKRTSAPSDEGVGPPVLACCAELAPHAMRVPKVRATKAAAIGRSDLSPMRLHADISPFSSCWVARAVGDYLPFNSRPCRSVSQPQLGHVQPWDVHHVDPGFLLDQLAADVVAGADAGAGVGELAGILFCVFDELGHIAHRQ